MKIKLKIISSMIIAILCCLTLTTVTVFADTVVPEPEVELPATIEIQLGPQWTGVQFQLKTDEGLYPEGILVGADGVLRLGLSGSEKYILSCMSSRVPIPAPEETSIPTTTKNQVVENQMEASKAGSGEDSTPQLNGIPLGHIILFGGGMILAIGALIIMHVLRKRRLVNSQWDCTSQVKLQHESEKSG